MAYPWIRIAIALLYVYVIAIGCGSLLWPLGRDQGIFAWAGDVLVGGGAPFADAWDVKGVATYYTFSVSQLLFGRTMWGIRALDLAALVVTCVFLYRFLSRRGPKFGAHFGVIFFALFYLSAGYWSTAQPDGWAAMSIVIASTLVLKPTGVTTHDRLLAGALVGLATLYKLLFAGFLLPLMIYECLDPDRRRLLPLDRLWPLITGSLGVLAASLIVLIGQGALDEFVQIQFEFNPEVHSQTRRFSFTRTSNQFSLFFRYFWWAIPFAAAGVYGLWRRERRLAWALLAQFLVAMFCIAIQNKYYSYHWHPLRMSLLILMAFGFSEILLLADASIRRQPQEDAGSSLMWSRSRAADAIRFGGLAAAICIAVLFGPNLNRAGWSAFVTHTMPLEEYYKTYKSIYNWSFKFSNNLKVVEYISENTLEEDSVLVWGFEPMINFLSGRRSPTRFGYNYPLVANVDASFTKSYRSEFLAALSADPPEYIVVGVGDQNSLLEESSRSLMSKFVGLSNFVERNYDLETHVGAFELWRAIHR
jgi:hypothetical protein